MSKFLAVILIFQIVFVSQGTFGSLFPKISFAPDGGMEIDLTGPHGISLNITFNPINLSAGVSLSVPFLGIQGSASTNNLTLFGGNIAIGNFTAAGVVDLKALNFLGGQNGEFFNGNITFGDITASKKILIGPDWIYENFVGNEHFPLLRTDSINISSEGVVVHATGPIIDFAKALHRIANIMAP